MSYRHLLGLPLRHKMADIEGLLAELQTLMKLDGSRPMTADFKLGGNDIILGPYTSLVGVDTDYEVRVMNALKSSYITLRMGKALMSSMEPTVSEFYVTTRFSAVSSVIFRAFDPYWLDWAECARLKNGELGISRAGNIVLLDNRFLTIGKTPSLPTPSAANRGKTIRIEGGEGVADALYVCRKLADESYEWTQVA